MQSRPRKLLDQVRHTIRLKHYSTSTEEAYVVWIKRYVLFHDKRHPRDIGIAEAGSLGSGSETPGSQDPCNTPPG